MTRLSADSQVQPSDSETMEDLLTPEQVVILFFFQAEDGIRDGVGEAEADGDGLGQDGQREGDRQREGERGDDVLPYHGVGSAADSERAGVDGRAQAAAEGAEDVPPHADGGGDEHEQTRQGAQGAGDGGEGPAGGEGT